MLKKARQAQGKSQKDFATIFGVTQQTISSWETIGNIPPDRVEEVYRVYGVDPDSTLDDMSESDRELVSMLLRYGNQAIKEDLREKLESIRSLSGNKQGGSRSPSQRRQASYNTASHIQP